jgi:F-type H+-transporting ATPase subunit gamma
METLDSLRSRIDTIEELHSVVRTMKTISMVSIRQYERAIRSLAEYSRALEMGLQAVLRGHGAALEMPPVTPGRQVGAIVLGSEQGMVGQFNDQIAAFAVERLTAAAARPEDRAVIAVGSRVAERLAERHQAVEEVFDLPGSAAGITPRVQELLLQVEAWREEGRLDRLLVCHHRPLHRAAYEPHLRQLLPMDRDWLHSLAAAPWPARGLPAFTLPRERLFATLVGHYLFVSLFQTFAESLAAENASRLAAMQAAESNIEDRLGELKLHFNTLRQTAITEELLDIMVSFEAATGRKR